jgi:hypothetical protein
MTQRATIPNRPTIDDLARLEPGAIAALPTDVLSILQGEVEAALAYIKTIKDRFDHALDVKFASRAAAARGTEGKDTGTVRIAQDDCIVIADLPKRVKWDQTRLAEVVERIRASGEDPSEYVALEYRISERAYGAWPQSIRSVFAPARTVETGKSSYRIERTEDTR